MSTPTDLLPRQKLMVRLITKKGPRPRRTHELARALTVMGSGEGCDVVLRSELIDAAHVAIVKLGGCVYVHDLGSPHGTMLNGRRKRWAKVTTGDQIVIGPYKFKVQVESTEQDCQEEEPVFRLGAPEDGSSESASGSTFESRYSALIVGSDPACDLVASGEEIAPRHCLLIWTEAGPIIRGLHTFGTVRLNGRPIDESYLLDGDMIGVGEHTFRFETEIEPTTTGSSKCVEDGSSFLAHIGAADPSSIIAGRLDMNGGDGLHRLWACGSEAKYQGKSMKKRPSSKKKSMLRTEIKEKAMANMMRVKKADIPVESDSRQDVSEIQAEDLKTQTAEIHLRVVAAQRALDERARKYREGLDLEHERLDARESELERQALVLREATLRGHEEAGKSAPGSSNESPEPEGSEDSTSPEAVSDDPKADDAPAATLDRRVAELVALAKSEQEEIKEGAVTIESLRLETQRLRSSVTRRLEKLQARKASLDEKFKSLTSGLEILRNQREPLVARLRKLDAEESSIQSRLEEGERIRGELARDAEALNRAQERLKARQAELLTSLENERLRLQHRQADMQRKAAELEQILHGRLGDIEDELNARRAELEAPVCDLSMFVVAGEGAGSEAGETGDLPPRLEMSDQVEALGRVEQQAAKGVGRLDALRKKISALGSPKTGSTVAHNRSTFVTGNRRRARPAARPRKKADSRIVAIGDELGPQGLAEKVA